MRIIIAIKNNAQAMRQSECTSSTERSPSSRKTDREIDRYRGIGGGGVLFNNAVNW
jgi:hypothetical protein